MSFEPEDRPPDTANTGRRAQYRVEIDEEADLHVSVQSRDTDPASGRLMDVSAAGAGVSFDGDASPTYRVGQAVDLVFASERFSTPLTIASRVQHRAEDQEEGRPVRRFGFHFLEPQQLDAFLPSAMREFFNRRQLVRVQPDSNHPVPVTIEAVPGSTVLEARLLNLSIMGVGISLEAEAESVLAEATGLVVSVSLPDTRKPISLMGSIRYRRLVGRRIHYGIEFDTASARFDQKQGALSKYVCKRQMEYLRATD